MNKIILIIILLLCQNVFTQGIIITKKADKISAKVEKIGVNEIEYRKWEGQTHLLFINNQPGIIYHHVMPLLKIFYISSEAII